MNTVIKETRGGRVYVAHTFISCQSLREVGTGAHTGQDLEAGADIEATEGSCLLSCFLWLAQPVFL